MKLHVTQHFNVNLHSAQFSLQTFNSDVERVHFKQFKCLCVGIHTCEHVEVLIFVCTRQDNNVLNYRFYEHVVVNQTTGLWETALTFTSLCEWVMFRTNMKINFT